LTSRRLSFNEEVAVLKKAVSILLLAVFPVAVLGQDAGTTWTKVRYNGGPLQTKVDPKNWNNRLTVSSDLVRFTTEDSLTFELKPEQVTGLSYGIEAHRHVAMMVSLGVILTPLALFGLFHKQKLHFIGIEYEKDGKKGGLLLQGSNDNYKSILFQLKSVTGKEIQSSEEDKLDGK